jgi:hypothetical protein
VTIDIEDETACMACLDRFMDAVNAHDVSALEREMHFPHIRIAAGGVVTYPEPGSNPLDLFERLQREDDWHRSYWISKAIVQGDDKKAHIIVRYVRLRRDGSQIGEYDSLYILLRVRGRWGVLARSSFGP